MNCVEKLAEKLELQTGLDCRRKDCADLLGSLNSFASGKGIACAEACARKILDDENLFREFHGLLLVPETWLFRQRAQLDFLGELFLLRPDCAGEKFRVLCAPCATGEEAYSACAALFGMGATPDDFLVDACDISGEFLKCAQRGVYGRNSAREAVPQTAAEYFKIEDGRMEASEKLKGQITFFRANLAGANAFFPNAPYDVIFCRNLAIYFSPAARKKLFDNILKSLATDGVVLTGYAEDFPFCDGRFASVGFFGEFACARKEDALSVLERLNFKVSRGVRKTHSAEFSAGRKTPEGIRSVSELLRVASELANAGRLAEAFEKCLEDIAFLPTSRNLFLAGDICLALSNYKRAAEFFKRSAALDPSDGQAYFKLHLICARTGAAAQADLYLVKFRERMHLSKRGYT